MRVVAADRRYRSPFLLMRDPSRGVMTKRSSMQQHQVLVVYMLVVPLLLKLGAGHGVSWKVKWTIEPSQNPNL